MACSSRAPNPHLGEVEGGRLHRMGARATRGIKRFVVLFLYLWLLFGLFVVNERIILQQHGIGFSAQGFAVINAFVLAKVMLVAEELNLGLWLRCRPLIYPILYESLVFTALFLCFHVGEGVVIGFVKGKSLAASVPVIGGGGLAGLVCVAVILFVALTPFFAFRNLSHVIGPERLNAMLFGEAPSSPTVH